jgi:hypothetical protein
MGYQARVRCEKDPCSKRIRKISALWGTVVFFLETTVGGKAKILMARMKPVTSQQNLLNKIYIINWRRSKM